MQHFLKLFACVLKSCGVKHSAYPLIVSAHQHFDQRQRAEPESGERREEGGVMSVHLHLPRQNDLSHR